MALMGSSYIAGAWHKGESPPFYATNPLSAQLIEPCFYSVSSAQMAQALIASEQAMEAFSLSSLVSRARFLYACADEILALGDTLLERVILETGYSRARVEAERSRTCGHLRMFADFIQTGAHLDVCIDTALPNRSPLPRPDLRSMKHAIGPVLVFGASNFPLAYSVAGGDSASAFAAGCPVIVKGHPSHPGTSELVAQAIVSAVNKTGMPAGVFSFIQGNSNEVGAYLACAPQVKALGFTGSMAGGMALFALVSKRPEPIPVFAEMGSVNPIFLLESALLKSTDAIAKGFVESLTLGAGQFCVNPGLLVAVKSVSLERFKAALSAALADCPSDVMLNQGIHTLYQRGTQLLSGFDGVGVIAEGQACHSDTGFLAQAQVFKTTALAFLADSTLQEEVFGACSLLVECENESQLFEVAQSLHGQLTATVHVDELDFIKERALISLLSEKAGRLVINGFPTGVEVVPSMVHGGPFPATTDVRFTSVGTAAIERFLRPVCYQNFPQPLLPEMLRDNNPLNIPRRVNGKRE